MPSRKKAMVMKTSSATHPTILALDTGGDAGWAFGQLGAAPPLCGTWPLRIKGDSLGQVMATTMETVWQAIQHHKPDIVTYEQIMPAALKNSAANISHVSIAAIVHLACFRAGIEPEIRHLSSIRRRIIRRTRPDKGKNIKDYVIAEVVKRGCQPDSHNAADACALWYYEESQQLLKIAGYRR